MERNWRAVQGGTLSAGNVFRSEKPLKKATGRAIEDPSVHIELSIAAKTTEYDPQLTPKTMPTSDQRRPNFGSFPRFGASCCLHAISLALSIQFKNHITV